MSTKCLYSRYSLFPSLFIALTCNKKQPTAFGAAPAFYCIILSFLGLSFCHIPNNLSKYTVLTANASFYQISWTWSNHDNATISKINQATDLRGWKKHRSESLYLLDTNIKSRDDDTTDSACINKNPVR
jgi:hypothetical protein